MVFLRDVNIYTYVTSYVKSDVSGQSLPQSRIRRDLTLMDAIITIIESGVLFIIGSGSLFKYVYEKNVLLYIRMVQYLMLL